MNDKSGRKRKVRVLASGKLKRKEVKEEYDKSI